MERSGIQGMAIPDSASLHLGYRLAAIKTSIASSARSYSTRRGMFPPGGESVPKLLGQLPLREGVGYCVKIELTEVKPNSIFVDLTRFPLAKMYDSHELIKHGNKLEIKTTIRIEGALSFLWRKLVAENVANGMEE